VLIGYRFSNKVQPKILNPKIHVSKPENEALERKEGSLRVCDEVSKAGSNRLHLRAQSKGCRGVESSRGQVRSHRLGEDQVKTRTCMGPGGLFSWLLHNHSRQRDQPKWTYGKCGAGSSPPFCPLHWPRRQAKNESF
jgi:hypothetical protein